MDSVKHGSCETSSEENDQMGKSSDDNTGIGRSYECTFCKRGFTNAQALGGHMNIHRKDKAKAKQQQHTQEPSFSKKSKEEYPTSRHIIPSDSSREQAMYYAALGAQVNYHHQFNFPESSPSYIYANHQSCLPISRPDLLGSNHPEDHLGANFSRQIGPPHVEDCKGKKEDERKYKTENDVDLELRLGYDP